ncbi:hypothetical protein [Nocardioides sp. YIM 152588]|uniref:Rv1678 family membrane protein n=1 Tax=Nocardioides sp. YIM 152588 TaxID=3158259 RepID=UPI0032E42D92
MRLSPAATVSWLLAPADDEQPRGHAAAAAFLRVLLGLMWLYNVAWKRPPGFGESTDSGLYHFTAHAVDHPVLPPYSWLVENLVLPNIAVFGWGVLVVETALAVMLLTGAWVRLAAVLGVAQSLAIGLSVAYAPNEWPWSYWLMIGAHVLLLFSVAGRWLAVDAVRSGTGSRRTLATVWGWLAVAVGGYSALRSFGDPLAARGEGLRSTDLSISLGLYNLLGGVVMVALGLLLLAGTRTHAVVLLRGAAGLAVLAAVSLHAQIGFSDPLLGGDATAAAVFLAIAVVALTASAKPTPRTSTEIETVTTQPT